MHMPGGISDPARRIQKVRRTGRPDTQHSKQPQCLGPNVLCICNSSHVEATAGYQLAPPSSPAVPIGEITTALRAFQSKRL